MVTIIQGFRRPNPIAKGIENAAHALFGDRLTPALKRAQLEAAQQRMAIEDAERRNLEAYAQGLDPGIQGAVLGGLSGKDAGDYNLLNTARGLAVGEGPIDLEGRGLNAAQLGAGMAAGSTGQGFREGERNQTARSRYSADSSAAASRYSADVGAATRRAIAENELAWERERFGMEPEVVIDPQGNPVLRPRSLATSGAHGFTAPISDTEATGSLKMKHFGDPESLSLRQAHGAGLAPSNAEMEADLTARALREAESRGTGLPQVSDEVLMKRAGLNPPEFKSYETLGTGEQFWSTDGGRTDAETGLAMPPAVELGAVRPESREAAGLTTATQTALQGEAMQNRRALGLINHLEKIAASDPSLFGAGGIIRRAGQGAANFVKTMDAALGGNTFQQTYSQIEREYTDPARVDPSARPAVFSLVYDPGLDSVSRFHGIMVYRLAGALAGQEGRSLSDNDIKRVLAAFPPPTGVWTSQEAFLTQLNDAKIMLGINQNANLEERTQGFEGAGTAGTPQVASEADYQALPSGTRFIDPEGNERVKP